ncbi:MAG TPA: sialidase family protein [Candidatus Lokiarchaeia archaeon]|nr:sialidase family protein [Candidatus Lokiarchaeia archaeon]
MVAYAIITNIIFIWRTYTGRKVKPAEQKKRQHAHVKEISGSVLHLFIGLLLVGFAVIVLSIYGGDLFGEASYLPVGVLGVVCVLGYAIVIFASGIRTLYFEHRHLPHAKIGTGFLGIGLILLVTLPVAGASTLFVNCNNTYTIPVGITIYTNLFTSGDNGYNTYKIPSLAIAPNGTILAFCEGRKNSNADHGDIQIVMRKSYDNGGTWTPMQILVNAGPITAGNPCPVVDHMTGTIWMLYCLDNLRVLAINSTNNGETWSVPRDITTNVTDPSWTWVGTGPGNGIELASGRLLVPTYHIIGSNQYCGIIYSDDHGVSWKTSTYVNGLFEEPQAVQLVNGTVLLSLRPDSGVNLRAEAFSNDGGITWSAATYTNLTSPSCQGSIIRYTNTSSYSKNRIIFSNPDDTRRDNLVIRLSYDEGKTWTYSKPLWVGPAGYSDLAITKTMQICSLFECGSTPCSNYYEHIAYARYNLTWLTNGNDSSL